MLVSFSTIQLQNSLTIHKLNNPRHGYILCIILNDASKMAEDLVLLTWNDGKSFPPYYCLWNASVSSMSYHHYTNYFLNHSGSLYYLLFSGVLAILHVFVLPFPKYFPTEFANLPADLI